VGVWLVPVDLMHLEKPGVVKAAPES